MLSNSISLNLRELAKSEYYQALYNEAKELKFRIFINDIDLTLVQTKFLYWLGFYSSLYVDCALGNVSELVFEDVIYEDAYNIYKRDKNLNKDNKEKIGERIMGKNKESVTKTQWIFKSPKKE